MDQLNARVLYLMEQKALSKSQLARIIEVSPSIMSHIASGRNKVGVEVIQKLIDAFPDVSPGWLLSGNGSMLGEANHAKMLEIQLEYRHVMEYMRELENNFVVVKRKMDDLMKRMDG